MTDRFTHSLDDAASPGGPGRDPAPPPLPGALGERFVAVRELGRGGMGTVVLARPRATAAAPATGLVAIKLLEERAGGSAAERLLREAETIARLDHPNIVRVLEVAHEPDALAIVMEHVDGGDLERYAQSKGTLEPREALAILLGVVDALAHAHDRGIVHRDVKPQNVLLGPSRVPKLCDFGLARAEGIHSLTGGGSLTLAGAMLGTLDYMAPEQRTDPRAVDGRADIFGVGATLYRLVVGSPPHVVREARVPEAVRDIVLRCLEERPDDRYPSADALGRAIRERLPADVVARVEAARRAPAPAKPADADDPGSRPASVAAAAPDLAALVADALAVQSHDGGPIEEALALVGAPADAAAFSEIARQLGMEPAAIDGPPPPPQAIARVPRAVAERYRLVPIAIDGDATRVAVADPGSLGAVLDVVRGLTGGPVTGVLAPPDAVAAAIERAYGPVPDAKMPVFEPPKVEAAPKKAKPAKTAAPKPVTARSAAAAAAPAPAGKGRPVDWAPFIIVGTIAAAALTPREWSMYVFAVGFIAAIVSVVRSATASARRVASATPRTTGAGRRVPRGWPGAPAEEEEEDKGPPRLAEQWMGDKFKRGSPRPRLFLIFQLVALVFILFYVWHTYVRRAALQEEIKRRRQEERRAK